MFFNSTIWGIAAVATLGMIARPWNSPEFVWAIAGATTLVLFNLLPWQEAVTAVGRGADVYLFLIGMMLLSEVARKEGLFDWLATQAVTHARGSAKRLFLIIYVIGILVTSFLSNDATAVVMTPAVHAAARAAQVEPLPYLFICAFIANAASFALPIANPANLVVFGGQMPALSEWLRYFAGPSFVAILATYVGLRLMQRPALDAKVATITGAPVDVRWQAYGARNCADCGGATVGICIRPATWVTDLLCRRVLGRDRAGNRPAIAGADSQECFVERAAARCWSIRSCRGGEPNRCVVSAGPQPARCCRDLAAIDAVDRRRRRRCCLKPLQQSAGGSGRGGHKSCCAGAPAGGWRDTDRRRPRAQSFRDGIARHNPVADRIAPGRRERDVASVS
jgi:Citrate transporter